MSLHKTSHPIAPWVRTLALATSLCWSASASALSLPDTAADLVRSADGLAAGETPVGNLALRQVYTEAAAGRGAAAKQARNALIARWLGGLHEAGLADYTVRHLDKGLIYSVRLRNPVDGGDIHALWVAVPDGPDLPSSVLLRATHHGTADATLLEMQSCTSRRTLNVSEDGLREDQAEDQAVHQLSDYLNSPDPMPITVTGEPRDICRQISRVLPSPGQ